MSGQNLLVRPDGDVTRERTPEGAWTNIAPLNAAAVSTLSLEDCEDAWNEEAVANVTSEVDAADYKVGSNSVRLTVAAGFTTGILAYETINIASIADYTHIALWAKTDHTGGFTAGQIQLLLDDTAKCASPLETLSLPALTAGEWKYCLLPLANPATDLLLISIGVKTTVDFGAGNPKLWLDDIRAVKVTEIAATGVEIAAKRLVINTAGHATSAVRLVTAGTNELVGKYSTVAQNSVDIGVLSTDGLWVVGETATAPCPDITIVHNPA